MARRRKKRSRRKARPSLLLMGGVAGTAMPGLGILLGAGTIDAKARTIAAMYGGHDGNSFRLDLLTKTYGPMVVTALIKKGLSMAGLRMPRGIPVNF